MSIWSALLPLREEQQIGKYGSVDHLKQEAGVDDCPEMSCRWGNEKNKG